MSTRTAVTIVGGIVGAYFGYPQLGLAVGALVGGAVDPQTIQGPKIGEVSVQTSAEGAPRTIVYGTAAVFGNIIQTGPVIKTTSTESSDGKGGSTTEGEVAYRSFAIRVCEGPILGYLRIWEDNKLVYDVRPGSAMLAESAAWAANVNFFYGDEEQLPSTFLTVTVNPDTPAYRGTAYFVVGLKDVTDRRGSIPQYRSEVAGAATLSFTNQPLIVHPWITAVSPLNPLNQHTYKYIGFGSQPLSPQNPSTVTPVTRATLAEALQDMYDGWNGDAAVSVPPSISSSFAVGWNDGGGFFPSVTNVASEQETLQLSYNELTPASYSAVSIPYSTIPIVEAGGIHSADTPRDSVWYRSTPSDAFTQWVDPDRSYSTETFTNVIEDGKEVFYTYDGYIVAKRLPIPPTGSTLVIGTAKQLAQVTYSGGGGSVLIQNGLGPVLLPDDPNYNNSDFWDAARDAAVDAGVMDPGLGYPVVVSSYGSGYNLVAGEPVLLADIIANIHNRCGIDASRYDVSELFDLVLGLSLSGDYTGADAINTIRPVYFFDKSEHDRKLWYPKRGAAVVETLTIDDLIDVPDTTQREQAIEVPKKLHFFYQHPGSGYARVKATTSSSSPDLMTTGEVSIEAPVSLNENQAAQVSDKMYKVTRAEISGTTEISVPLNVGLKYVSSNPTALSLRNSTRRHRVDSMSYADGVIKFTLKNDRQSAYTSHLTGVPIPPPSLPPPTLVGQTILAVLDIAARVDSEDDLNYLVAVTGESPAWYGARYQRSLDGGENYNSVQDITKASIFGEITEAVETASEFFTDTTNTVVVRLYRDGQTLDSQTLQQFLSEGGAFALEKEDGSWEIMQYLDADLDSSGDFTLSTLHRGLLNSGPDYHSIGARFVMLARPQHIPAQSSWIGQALTHRAISLGDIADNTENEETATFVGRSQLEWPIAYLMLARVGDMVTAFWTPRHRFGSDDAPIASINFQGYRVTIEGTGTITFDQTSNTFTTDVSSIGGAVTVSISALNRITGAGPATTESI